MADRLDTTAVPVPPPLARTPARDIEPVADDRNELSSGQPVLLVVEDDPHCARILDRLHRSGEDLVGCTALLVDDDARNIFALSSVLERRGMRARAATTGSEAVAVLEASQEVSLILMDIMMPGMDGFQTIETMRRNPRWHRLPIIALTAKAMKGERDKCLESGASDYLAKPVDTEQLLAALCMWLHR